MTIFDRAATTKRIRIDATQLADELAKHRPDIEEVREAAATAVHDAADSARQSIDRAAEIARGLRSDLVHAVEKAQADSPVDSPVDELGQRLRGASTNAIRAIAAPGRSKLLIVGIVGIAVSVSAGVVAVVLLEPGHGKERRERIARRTSSLTHDLGARVGGTARSVSDRARGIAIERGLVKAPSEPAAGPAEPEGAVAESAPTEPEALPVAGEGGETPQLVGIAPSNGAGPNGADAAPDHGATRPISG